LAPLLIAFSSHDRAPQPFFLPIAEDSLEILKNPLNQHQ